MTTDRPWVTRVRAVIADRRTRLLLVEDGDRHRLPFVEVEGTDDELPTIRAALAGFTGLETIVVRAIERSVHEEQKVVDVALELEPLGAETPVGGAVWLPAPELDDLLSDDDRALVTRYMDDRPPPERPHWARRGWFSEAALWIEETLAARGRDITAPIEQISSWCISSILRADTEAGRVFFKATAPSPLFVDEGTVLKAGTREKFNLVQISASANLEFLLFVVC